MTDLIKCSACKCMKLLSLFSIRENTGIRLKTCISCRSKLSCDKCEYKCSKNSDLTKHIKQVHDKIKDIQCDKCEYKYSSNSNLKQHMKQVHDKIKDFQCDKCEYKCSFNGSLNQHIKTCTGLLHMSAGEFKIIEKLKELKLYKDIDYYHNLSCSELTDYSKRSLRFDFKFINHKIAIEFDGIQHFKPQRFGGISEEKALNNFNDLIITDNFKNKFCIDNDIKMIRISYLDFDKIETILHNELIHITNLD